MALVLNGSANTLTGLATAGAGIPGSEVVAAGAIGNGGIIQVKNVHFQGVDSTSHAAQSDGSQTIWEYDNANLRVGITPTAASNKILVMGHISLGSSVSGLGIFVKLYRRLASGSGASVGMNTASNTYSPKVIASDSEIYSGSSLHTVSFNYLDTPANASDEHVYYFGLTHNSSSARTIGINRTGDNGDNYYNPRGTSGITLMEIVA